jgi:hypothetical protein
LKQMRLRPYQVLAAGGVIAAAIVLLFLFVLIRPRTQQTQRDLNAALAEEEYASTNRPIAERNLVKAQAEERRVNDKYDEIMETRMPDISLQDPLAAMFRLWDFPREEGQLMESWLASTGAQVSSISLPSFGTAPPNPNMRVLPPVDWSLSVSVKDLPTFFEWLKMIPEAPRFLLLRNVRLGGSRQPGTPLSAGVDVTLYLWTQPPEPVQAADESEAAGATVTEGAAAPAAGEGGGPARRAGRGQAGRGARMMGQ